MILGPTVATLGMSIQIPMAAGVDFILGRAKWLGSRKTTLMTLLGTFLILGGFCVINIPASASHKKDKKSSMRDIDESEPRENEALLSGGIEASEVEMSCSSKAPSEIE